MAAPLTVTERQLLALYGSVRSDNLTNARMGVPTQREVRWVTGSEIDRPVTEVTHLTNAEMRDLERRLEAFLFPVTITEAAISIVTEGS